MARWTIQCDGLVTYQNQVCRCFAYISGELGEEPRDVWKRALALGWSSDLRTGKDSCGRKHRAEGGEPS